MSLHKLQEPHVFSFYAAGIGAAAALLVLASVFSPACFAQDKNKPSQDFRSLYADYRAAVRAGQAALGQNKYAAAAEHYTRALALSPFESSHYYYRGLARYRLADFSTAMEDFDRALVLEPGSFPALVYRGLCREKKGDGKGAEQDYRAALRLRPKDPGVHNNLACLYADTPEKRLQNPQKALAHALKAASLTQQKNPEVLDTLARAYARNGKSRDAVDAQRKALALVPGNGAFKKKLAAYERDAAKEAKKPRKEARATN